MTSMRPIEEHLSRIDATRKRPKLVPVPDAKGRPPLRQRPDDFEIIFVQIGRIDCEVFYRAARITIDRWLDEVGKDRLIELRKAFVARERKMAKMKKPPRPQSARRSARDRRRFTLCVLRAAAHHLRIVRNGGFIVSPTGQGDYWVGTSRRWPGELVDMAVARGFDLDAAKKHCVIIEREESDRS